MRDYLAKEISLGRTVGSKQHPNQSSGSFQSQASPENGVSLWTCQARQTTVSTTGLSSLALPATRRRTAGRCTECTWYPTGKDGRGKRLPDRPSASTGPTPLGGAVGRPAFLRHKTPLRTEIGAKIFHGVGRRTAVVVPGAKSIVGWALPR